MKSVLYVLLPALAVLSFAFCKSNKYTTENLPDKQLCWGHGGGFTGVEYRYQLLENGQIFTTKAQERMEVKPSAKARVAKNLFEQALALGLDTLNYSEPGNVYSFVEMVNGDQVNRVVWGGKDTIPSAEIQALYQSLNALLPRQ